MMSDASPEGRINPSTEANNAPALDLAVKSYVRMYFGQMDNESFCYMCADLHDLIEAARAEGEAKAKAKAAPLDVVEAYEKGRAEGWTDGYGACAEEQAKGRAAAANDRRGGPLCGRGTTEREEKCGNVGTLSSSARSGWPRRKGMRSDGQVLPDQAASHP